MNENTERKLIEQAKTDPEMFGRVFDIYYPKVGNYILRRVGDPAAAQDITSVVFFKAWHNLPKFEWRGLPFSAWLYRIASNEVANHFRHQKNQPASLDVLFEETGFEPPSNHDTEKDFIEWEDTTRRHQDFLVVQKLVLELPLKYQEVLALRFFEKMPIKDIAQVIGKNENTVKSLLSRGTEKLRRNFSETKAL